MEQASQGRNQANGLKLQENRFQLTATNNFMTVKTVGQLNDLLQKEIVFPSLKVFKRGWTVISQGCFLIDFPY